MAAKFWIKDGKLVVDGTGHPILCEECPCGPSDSTPFPCCDSFAVCIDETTPIKNALFANVFIYDDVLMTTLLANFSMPINYTATANYNGFTRAGWFGCEARDPDTECVNVATVFMQCESSEFKIAFNGFTVSGHTLCDGFISTVGNAGTVDLVATPFSISSTGVSFSGGFSSPGCGDIFVVVEISE